MDPCGIKSGGDPWYGITCNSNGRVIKIELPDSHLDGILDLSMVELFSELTVFDVRNNNITGVMAWAETDDDYATDDKQPKGDDDKQPPGDDDKQPGPSPGTGPNSSLQAMMR